MVLWGGLRPILSQLVLDAVTLVGWTWSLHILPTRPRDATKILVASCVLLLSTAGGNASNRWTITAPMVPFLILHVLHRIILLAETSSTPTETIKSKLDESKEVQGDGGSDSSKRRGACYRWVALSLSMLSLLCIFLALALTILFPAVELPPVPASAPYHVGSVDFYIPIPATNATTTSRSSGGAQYLPARLLYPTQTKPGWWRNPRIPYLNPNTAVEFCRHSMQFGAPPPLKPFGWMLHHWRVTTLPVTAGAPILENSDDNDSSLLPLVVFSHGLGGSLDIYSYQTVSLAAHGTVVLSLTHTDGSAPVAPQPATYDSHNNHIPHDAEILNLHFSGDEEAYKRARRAQTEIRIQEMLGAVDFIRGIIKGFGGEGLGEGEAECSTDDYDILGRLTRQTTTLLRPLVEKIQPNHTFLMGHSFGGTTALAAAMRRPDHVKAVIAHEPAIEWLPDDVRRSLLADEEEYDGDGLEGIVANEGENNSSGTSSIHDHNLLILNSQEWQEKAYGNVELLQKMHQNGRLGKKGGHSRHQVIRETNHNEFSDTCMLTPLWLARPVGLTGPRNPLQTAEEIAEHTRAFMEEAHRN